MHAVVGTLLIALMILSFAVLLLAARNPSPPPWAHKRLIYEITSIGIVSMGAFGIAFVVQSIALFTQQPLTVTHAIFIALILVVFGIVWPRLRVGTTLADYARREKNATQASAPDSAPEVTGISPESSTVTAEDPDSPTRPRTPRWPKKAATRANVKRGGENNL